MDDLDLKLVDVFSGKVVRKDLLHRIKKGTNVPTFVLEFLLARYCASEEEAEIQAGLEAVLATLQDNYVRPDEANSAQSRVATRGRHRFIDKAHVNYIEREKRHWAALENFNSQRVAISEKFFRDNDRLLEGGIWAEVTIGYNDTTDDDYTFYIEDLRPIQLSRFDFDGYIEGRKKFTRDDWLDIILRSVGLEPSKISHRVKLHFIIRLASLVEPNFNFIELGPRGTGKSYFFSEFSPYSTLVSGGQATKAVLFYNNARKRIGLVGFWDTVAFDEVAGINIKDVDTVQIMKDFMANGRFSRGVEVIADASLAFNGNIDHSIDQLVNSSQHDLFISLPKEFDLAIMDRFYCYLPGWEMPKTSSEFLTNNYGFITDYLAEAFHHMFAHTNRYEEVNKRIQLGPNVEGRDEKGIKKIVGAFLKILHPDGPPSDGEFEEYVAYAVEARRRVKEQMNKRKPDDEFARINLSYFTVDGREVVVYCPESRNAIATQHPTRKSLNAWQTTETAPAGRKRREKVAAIPIQDVEAVSQPSTTTTLTETDKELKEKHFTIFYGDTGYSYETIIGPYLHGAKAIEIEDPYIRMPHQIQNFVRLCETVVKLSNIKRIDLTTGYDDETQKIRNRPEAGRTKAKFA
jgi:ATP-dependent Lon protease